MKIPLAFVLLAVFSAAVGFAVESTPADPAARAEHVRKLAAELKLETGPVLLRGGLAKVTLPASLRYLNPRDTNTVITDIWGNPRGDDTLGMLVPADFDPLSDASWAVVMTFEEDGYVKDDDAAHLNYDKLLGEMKEGVRASSEERVKQGYPAIELVGWAAPPRYDSAAKKLYWAKELKFADSPEHTLNYNLRLLGRRGVLVLNAVAGMEQLKMVEAATPEILAAVNFQEGHRYADYNADTDKTATYGLAALVAGGVAAKTGLLKGLWLAIIAMKKFVVIALIALVGGLKKLFAWMRGRETRANSSAQNPLPPSA